MEAYFLKKNKSKISLLQSISFCLLQLRNRLHTNIEFPADETISKGMEGSCWSVVAGITRSLLIFAKTLDTEIGYEHSLSLP